MPFDWSQETGCCIISVKVFPPTCIWSLKRISKVWGGSPRCCIASLCLVYEEGQFSGHPSQHTGHAPSQAEECPNPIPCTQWWFPIHASVSQFRCCCFVLCMCVVAPSLSPFPTPPCLYPAVPCFHCSFLSCLLSVSHPIKAVLSRS